MIFDNPKGEYDYYSNAIIDGNPTPAPKARGVYF
jgi:hypothetical protein